MDTQGKDIVASFKLSEEDKDDFSKIKEAFDRHYVARKTKMHERARFNTRVQLPGETVDSFITELHAIGKKCEYQSLTDELIRHRIIAGMANRGLAQQLQNLEKEPTLECCVGNLCGIIHAVTALSCRSVFCLLLFFLSDFIALCCHLSE